ncbi:Tat pathway signal sequence domain protein [Phenylobacterium sp.]|uniref:Tat pathway signal sequence domain protein n=1 Tax=Phenylobacterium sp. TaxID=1871053 RepID=UPI003564A130
MRRLILLAASAFMVAAPFAAHAQYPGGGGGGYPGGGGGAGGRGGGDQDKQSQDDAKKKKRDKDWGDNQAALPQLRNAGPCPFVKSLYDASRYVEFKDDREASANVGFSGEIQGISAGCQYKDDQPISVSMDVLFELGKGPMAQGGSKTYRYWVAVTDRNREVIARQEFDLPVNFNGKDRVYITDSIANIIIPRGTTTTSGANFEILVGFDVTPQMAAFNRLGKRFRVNAGTTAVASGDTTNRR